MTNHIDKPLDEKLAMIDPENYDFASDRQLIQEWKARIPKLLAHKEWQAHPVTVKIAEDMKISVERIDYILLNDEKISADERILFIREKKIIQSYLTMFAVDVSKELDVIEAGVNKEVE